MDYINTRILNYNISKKIGEGGMATVYEASHTTFNDRKVAIKILNPVLATNKNIRQRFLNEARIMASLQHEYIVHVLDFEEREDMLAIIMEKLEGISLSAFLGKNGPLNARTAKKLISEILSAFQFAHTKGVIHRDVKPSNVFILPNNKPKILDFGIAKLLSGNGDMTITGVQMGTLSYMSPEQVKNDTEIDHRSDIYSIGVLLYNILSGKKAYNSDKMGDFEIRKAIVETPLPHLNINTEFQAIIEKATAKNPKNRYQSCREFMDALSTAPGKEKLELSNNKQNEFEYEDEDEDEKTLIDIDIEEIPNITQNSADDFSKESHNQENFYQPTNEKQTIESNKQIKKYLLPLIISLSIIIGLLIWQTWPGDKTDKTDTTTGTNTTTETKPALERNLYLEPLNNYTEVINGVYFEMNGIKGGTFEMGSPEAEKDRNESEYQHTITVNSFYLGKFEVTQEQWRVIMANNPAYFKGKNLPVEQISWEEADYFVKKLRKLTGKNYRLPTSAEWEYACRANSNSPFSTGSCLPSTKANFDGKNPYSSCQKGNFIQQTTPVGSYPANAFGLFDMHGNVWEWCDDWYSKDYNKHSTKENPRGPEKGTKKVRRGGGWINNAKHCRSAYCGANEPTYKHLSMGLRIACSPN